MSFNIWNLRATFWGDEEDIVRIDFDKQRVELRESGWQNFNSVEFVIKEPFGSSFEDRVREGVDVKLKSEKETLIRKLEEVAKKEKDLDHRLNLARKRETLIVELSEKERTEFDKYVSDTVRNLNRIINDVYQQSQVKQRNEEMKQPTPEYIKYESKVFGREMMKAIEGE